MRKPKEQVDEEGARSPLLRRPRVERRRQPIRTTIPRDPRKPKKPARQRVELRNEQQTLRRQLSDWDDYGQDDFDTKL